MTVELPQTYGSTHDARRKWARAGLAAATVLGACLLPAPANADVKAGADAWVRGEQALRSGSVPAATQAFAQAVKEWQPYADQGDPDAQFDLAQAYKLGRGVPQDLKKAEMLYAKAAAQGHLQASDNYGLLLFQRGEHRAAMPYIKIAADRGDKRAQYLLGIAHFNEDGVPKDWVMAYALESLAAQPGADGVPGLPQAKQALIQMDKFISLQERQLAVSRATDLAAQIEANRQRQMANADLGGSPGLAGRKATGGGVLPALPGAAAMPAGSAGPLPPLGAMPDQQSAPPPASNRPNPRGLPPEPVARPRPAVTAQAPAPAPEKQQPERHAAPDKKPALDKKPTPTSAPGPWKIQLGAFGVASNLEAQWKRALAQPALAGHPRSTVVTGKVTRLLAGNFSEEAAVAACRKLSAAGIDCKPMRD